MIVAPIFSRGHGQGHRQDLSVQGTERSSHPQHNIAFFSKQGMHSMAYHLRNGPERSWVTLAPTQGDCRQITAEGAVGDSAVQPGVTCSRPDPPPQLLLFGSVLECAPPGWALSQEHRPKGQDVAGPVPSLLDHVMTRP